MNKTNEFIPFGNNLRVQPDVKDQILKTDTFCEHGKVVAVGHGVKKNLEGKREVEVGDEISFWLFGVKEVSHGEERHFIIPVDDKFILEIKRNG